jgi:hypothetical protein
MPPSFPDSVPPTGTHQGRPGAQQLASCKRCAQMAATAGGWQRVAYGSRWPTKSNTLKARNHSPALHVFATP